MKRILINAEQPNEVRIAYLEDGKLVDFEIESAARSSTKGNIYIGLVTAVKSDLEGAFVDIGAARHGLLSFSKAGGQVSRDPQYQAGELSSESEQTDLKVGQKILVQVFREARGDKGSALTTELSIPGRFVVLKPNSSTRAVTRNATEVQRVRMRELGNRLPNIENVGWIIRTTAVDHTLDEITGDFHRMMNLWRNIESAFEENQQRAPTLVYSDNTLMQRVLRDRLRRDGTTVIVDDPSLYRQSKSFASEFMPELQDQVELYRGDRPIFDAFRIENDVASSFARKVSLPSGGEIVFDQTEALLSIDVNSARNTSGANLEATALHTNLEAAHEIFRQLMIRNIGGLVVVDFIDMLTEGFNEQVETLVEESLLKDTTNSSSSKISEFGLMQLNRQRRRPSIYDSHFIECEHCQGARFVERIETNANQVLRRLSYLMHDTARPDNQYLCRVPDDVAVYILNKERQYLRDLEINTRKQVVIIPDATLSQASFDIKGRRVKGLDFEGGSNLEELLNETKQEASDKQRTEFPDEPTTQPEPLVSPLGSGKPRAKRAKAASPASKPKKSSSKSRSKKKGFFKRTFDALFGTKRSKTTKRGASAKTSAKRGKSPAKRTTSKSERSGSRSASASDAGRRAPNSTQRRTGNNVANRDDQAKRSNSGAGEPARAPRRSSADGRERSSRPRTTGPRGDSRTSNTTSDRVRRAADLKQSADAATTETNTGRETARPNRRMPRTARTDGPQSTADRPRERSQSTRSASADVRPSPRTRESAEGRPTARQPAKSQSRSRQPNDQRLSEEGEAEQSAGLQQQPIDSFEDIESTMAASSETRTARRPAPDRSRTRSSRAPAGKETGTSRSRSPTANRRTAESIPEPMTNVAEVATPALQESAFAGNDPRLRSVEAAPISSAPVRQPNRASEEAPTDTLSEQRAPQRSSFRRTQPTEPSLESPISNPPEAMVIEAAETEPKQSDASHDDAASSTDRAGNDPRKSFLPQT